MNIHRLVDDVRQRGFISLKPKTSAQDASQEMKKQGHSAALVMRDNDVLGIITTNDISFKVVAEGKSAEQTPVKEIMTSPVHKLKVSPDTLLEECLALMREKKVRHLPLIKAGKIVGLVNILMVAEYRHNEQIRIAMETSAAMDFAT